jgi:hypothetical protein
MTTRPTSHPGNITTPITAHLPWQRSARQAVDYFQMVINLRSTFQSWFLVSGIGFSRAHTTVVVVSGCFRVFQDVPGSAVNGHYVTVNPKTA